MRRTNLVNLKATIVNYKKIGWTLHETSKMAQRRLLGTDWVALAPQKKRQTRRPRPPSRPAHKPLWDPKQLLHVGSVLSTHPPWQTEGQNPSELRVLNLI